MGSRLRNARGEAEGKCHLFVVLYGLNHYYGKEWHQRVDFLFFDISDLNVGTPLFGNISILLSVFDIGACSLRAGIYTCDVTRHGDF